MASYKTEKAYVFDFTKPLNNEFMIANQFTIIEHGVEKRSDVITFVNGIPIVVIELKSAMDENVDITDAYNQLQTYKMTIPSLFTYNSFMVTSDGINARAGTLTSDEDRFMAWRTLNNRTSGGIIFTTIQKFAPEDKGDNAPTLTERKNVIVMADEAHRSQYGFGADIVKSEESADIKYGYAKYMRDSLPVHILYVPQLILLRN